MTEKSSENKLLLVNKQRQQEGNHILFKPRDKHLARNIAAKKIMAAELAAMGLSKKSISRLLNLEDPKEK